MNRKTLKFKERILTVSWSSRQVQTGATPGLKSDVVIFDVDVTTCIALFLENILHLKPFDKKSQSQNCQESLVLLQ